MKNNYEKTHIFPFLEFQGSIWALKFSLKLPSVYTVRLFLSVRLRFFLSQILFPLIEKELKFFGRNGLLEHYFNVKGTLHWPVLRSLTS